MIGFKYCRVNQDIICNTINDEEYILGEKYSIECQPVIGEIGFHFFKNIENAITYSNYFLNEIEIFEVECNGEIVQLGDFFACSEIKLLRKVAIDEISKNLTTEYNIIKFCSRFPEYEKSFQGNIRKEYISWLRMFPNYRNSLEKYLNNRHILSWWCMFSDDIELIESKLDMDNVFHWLKLNPERIPDNINLINEKIAVKLFILYRNEKLLNKIKSSEANYIVAKYCPEYKDSLVDKITDSVYIIKWMILFKDDYHKLIKKLPNIYCLQAKYLKLIGVI